MAKKLKPKRAYKRRAKLSARAQRALKAVADMPTVDHKKLDLTITTRSIDQSATQAVLALTESLRRNAQTLESVAAATGNNAQAARDAIALLNTPAPTPSFTFEKCNVMGAADEESKVS